MKIKFLFGILLVLLIIALIFSCTTQQTKSDNSKPGNARITQEQCAKAGGKWNECGSPCAGTNSEMCIQVCSPQCECGGIAGFTCPKGYNCRLSEKKADEIGVCVNS